MPHAASGLASSDFGLLFFGGGYLFGLGSKRKLKRQATMFFGLGGGFPKKRKPFSTWVAGQLETYVSRLVEAGGP